MGVGRWFCVVGLLPAFGCGLVDGDDASLEGCAEVASGKPDHVRTTRTDTESAVETSVTAFSADGALLHKLIDIGSDGTLDRETLYSLDAEGRVVRAEFDGDANGTVDQLTEFVHEPDGSRPLSETVDDGVDGVADSRVTWDYSVDGRELQLEDGNADGVIDWTVTTYYAADGKRLRVELDQDADGTPERTDDFTYDGDRLVQEATDGDGDGTPERVTTFSYDEEHDHRLSGYVVVDSVPEDLRTVGRYVYDDAGLQVRFEEDEGDDGTIDAVTRYGYDREGRKIRAEYPDGLSLCEYEYAEGSEPTEIRCDDDADGAWEYVTSVMDCPG